MQVQNPPYAYPNKGCLLPFLCMLLLALLAGLVQLHTFFTYQSYQQGRCTIISAMTTIHEPNFSKGSTTFYTADLQYTVLTSDGQKVNTDNSAGLFANRYPDFQDAQQVVDRYSVGKTYACWYNPANAAHAVLDTSGFNATGSIFSYIETSLGFLAGFCFLALVYHAFAINFNLRRRGVLTRGRVVEHVVKQGRSGKVTYSRIFYSPLDQPLQSYQIEQVGAYPLNSPQPICYDPVKPQIAFYGGRPRGRSLLWYLLVLSSGVLIAIGVLMYIWYGA